MYLGIDLGTQSLKAILVNADGDVVRSTQEAYGIQRQYPTWATQDPAEWWQALVNAVRDVVEDEEVDALSIAGQMHGLILVDRDGEIVRPAIIWMDRRSTAQVIDHADNPLWMDTAHNPLSTGMAAASLLWLRENEPETLKLAHTLLSPKDWLRFKLTGVLSSEPSDASGMLMLDVVQRIWSQRIAEGIKVPFAMLPRLTSSSKVVGAMTADAEASLGISAKVIAGAADQAAMLVGCGAIAPGDTVLTLGTGGQLSVVTDRPHTNPRLNTFCHVERKLWYSMGAILTGGYALTWWQNIIGDDVEQLLALAEEAPAGSDGLIFKPYLNGERTPYMDASLRAQFLHLHGGHTQAHMTRAVLEGVAFAMRECLETLIEAGVYHHLAEAPIILGGGGTRGDLWPAILASVLERPLARLTHEEQTAYGSAMMAAVGFGQFKKLEDVVDAWFKPAEVIEPVVDWVKVYSERFNEYRQ